MTDESNSTTRITRTPAERTAPVRNSLGAFRTPSSGTGTTSTTSALENGVATAYRVYEQYMLRGQRAAFEYSRNALNGDFMANMTNPWMDPATVNELVRAWQAMLGQWMGPLVGGRTAGSGWSGQPGGAPLSWGWGASNPAGAAGHAGSSSGTTSGSQTNGSSHDPWSGLYTTRGDASAPSGGTMTASEAEETAAEMQQAVADQARNPTEGESTAADAGAWAQWLATMLGQMMNSLNPAANGGMANMFGPMMGMMNPAQWMGMANGMNPFSAAMMPMMPMLQMMQTMQSAANPMMGMAGMAGPAATAMSSMMQAWMQALSAFNPAGGRAGGGQSPAQGWGRARDQARDQAHDHSGATTGDDEPCPKAWARPPRSAPQSWRYPAVPEVRNATPDRASVTVTMGDAPPNGALTVGDLRAQTGDERLSEASVEFVDDDGETVLSVHIGDDQAAGTYFGPVLDDDGVICGSIVVRVSGERE